jgi:hypothetical protein
MDRSCLTWILNLSSTKQKGFDWLCPLAHMISIYYTHNWDNHLGAMGGDVMTSQVTHPLQIVGSRMLRRIFGHWKGHW